ncbi:MAG: hypothetical protein SVR08_15400 [Spirochaetota bacterium]|nr:hypothetical protein [Spirochaetota bacterium]
MKKDKDVTESCFNYIIANNYKEAFHSYIDNYYKHPDIIELVYGVITSSILIDKITECISFLEKEISLSPLSNKIALVLNFIKLNSNFKNMSRISIILNIGLFLRKKRLLQDAKFFFRVCQTIEPDNRKILTVLGECAILERDIEKGIKLFSYAAKGVDAT